MRCYRFTRNFTRCRQLRKLANSHLPDSIFKIKGSINGTPAGRRPIQPFHASGRVFELSNCRNCSLSTRRNCKSRTSDSISTIARGGTDETRPRTHAHTRIHTSLATRGIIIRPFGRTIRRDSRTCGVAFRWLSRVGRESEFAVMSPYILLFLSFAKYICVFTSNTRDINRSDLLRRVLCRAVRLQHPLGDSTRIYSWWNHLSHREASYNRTSINYCRFVHFSSRIIRNICLSSPWNFLLMYV